MFKAARSPFVARNRLSKRRSSSSFGTPRSRVKRKKQHKNIKVCVRVRPQNSTELFHLESRQVVRVVDENLLTFDPIEQQTSSFYKGRLIKDPTAKRNKDLKFAFDAVFDAGASNRAVFEATTRTAIEKLLEGINCSVFAYGATGAGKTHTMVGTPDQPGVILQTMVELYERIEEMKDDVICDVKISYLEIYNENVRDLLRPESGGDLPLRDSDEGLTVSRLSYHKPENAGQLLSLLDFGNKNRSQHPTDANKESSRSHGVFQVVLEQRPRTADMSADVLVSKMSLIDLAGSERATATKNSGERFREGANINRSLLALGNCINALAEGRRGAHIPYRDSKLTRILKDSLGGNCHTIMIANVSPSSLTYEDTYNTLKYADRAKHIKAEAKKNVQHVDYHLHQYTAIVQELQIEIGELKEKLKTSRGENQLLSHRLEVAERRGKSGGASESETELLLHHLQSVLENYLKLERDLLHNESQHRIQELRIKERDIIQEYLRVIQIDPARLGKDTEKTSRIKRQCRTRQEAVGKKIQWYKEGIRDLKPVVIEALKKFLSEREEAPGSVCLNAIGTMEKDTRLVQLKAEADFLRSVLDQECGFVENQRRLIVAALDLALDQHLIISGSGMMASALKDKMDNVIRLVQGIKEVAWRDEAEEGVAFDLEALPDLILPLSAIPSQTQLASSSREEEGAVSSRNMPGRFRFTSPMPGVVSSAGTSTVKSLNFDAVAEIKLEPDNETEENLSPRGLNTTFTKLPLSSPDDLCRPIPPRVRLHSPPPPPKLEWDHGVDENAPPSSRLSSTFLLSRPQRKDPAGGEFHPPGPSNIPKTRLPSGSFQGPSSASSEEFKKPAPLPPRKKRPVLHALNPTVTTRGRAKISALSSLAEGVSSHTSRSSGRISPALARSPSCSKLPDFDRKLAPKVRLKKTQSSSKLHM